MQDMRPLFVPALVALGVFVLLWLIPGRPRRTARFLTLLGLCAALVPALTIAATAGVTIRSTLLDPSFYTESLKKAGMFSVISSRVAQAGAEVVLQNRQVPAAQREVLARLMKESTESTVDAAWVERQFGRIFPGIVNFLKGAGPEPDLKIDLREVKSRALAYLGKASPATPLAAELGKAWSSVPDEINPSTFRELGRLPSLLWDVRSSIQPLLLLGPIALAAMGAAGLTVLLVAGRAASGLRWAGTSILAGGMIDIAAAVLGGPRLLQGLVKAIQAGPELDVAPVRSWFEQAVSQLARNVEIAGLAFVGLGLVLLLASRFVRGRGADSGDSTSVRLPPDPVGP